MADLGYALDLNGKKTYIGVGRTYYMRSDGTLYSKPYDNDFIIPHFGEVSLKGIEVEYLCFPDGVTHIWCNNDCIIENIWIPDTLLVAQLPVDCNIVNVADIMETDMSIRLVMGHAR